MREILFRGKRAEDNKWVYGFVVNGSHSIIGVYEDGHCFCFESVIPETVGQYTGLCDKNGNKIFEGDIVRFSTAHAREIKYIDGCFGFEGSSIPIKYVNKFEVIGNIHDNPELLEE